MRMAVLISVVLTCLTALAGDKNSVAISTAIDVTSEDLLFSLRRPTGSPITETIRDAASAAFLQSIRAI